MVDQEDLLARVVRQVTDVLNARFDTFDARLEHMQTQREHGDAQISQTVLFLKDQVGDNTSGLGALDAKIERVEHDFQKAVSGVREQITSGFDGLKSEQVRAVGDSKIPLQQRVQDLERRWDRMGWIGMGLMAGSGLAGGGLAAVITTLLQAP